MKYIIKSYPKYTYIVSCSPEFADVKNLSRALAGQKEAMTSSLYLCGSGYCLCQWVPIGCIMRRLPGICEHSERVFIGRDYYSIVREHCTPLIGAKAIQILSGLG